MLKTRLLHPEILAASTGKASTGKRRDRGSDEARPMGAGLIG